jgi:hypothetical protein
MPSSRAAVVSPEDDKGVDRGNTNTNTDNWTTTIRPGHEKCNPKDAIVLQERILKMAEKEWNQLDKEIESLIEMTQSV